MNDDDDDGRSSTQHSAPPSRRLGICRGAGDSTSGPVLPPAFSGIPGCVPCRPEFLTSMCFSACSSLSAPVGSSVTSHQASHRGQGWLQSTVTRGKRAKLQFSPACATTHTHIRDTLFVCLFSLGEKSNGIARLQAPSGPQVLLRVCSTPTCSSPMTP